MDLGTATAAPGELARGYLDVTELPTSTPERLPVIIAEGEAEGPTLWVTAAIHGDEVTGMAAALDVMDERLPEELAGTVVCIPNLNPAGLRRNQRTSYYHDQDPNRHFPDADADSSRPPQVQELIDERVYDRFAESADALLDLHTATVGSMPFVIRDRVLYGDRRDEDEAEALAEDLADLVDALDLPVINEYAAEEYTEQNLQRSTAGAALNEAGIPACTLELGSHSVVEEDNRAAGVAAVYRAMVDLGMLDAVPDWATGPTVKAPVEYAVKRHLGPHTDTAGIACHRVDAGDVFEAGDSFADVVTPNGERRTTIEAEHDGFVLGRWEGVAVYENDPLASLAVRDDGDLVVPRDPDDE
ncbi:MAG TPA: succinylglutamate desuccinylase/aspartoacylase family protein [Natrialbaceae archaeon]|nr:succinylglutamate desuccinylase/aspartoacylase family protein [Natrialbaceae archaeon]